MKNSHKLALDEVAAILHQGAFDQLIGSYEHEGFECKSGFYDLRSQHGRIELAKDVSALANSRGGYLLIGIATAKDPLHQLDEVVSVSCFERAAFDLDQHRSIIGNLIYPSIRGLRVEWHQQEKSTSRGIASIFVPADCGEEQPYLVTDSIVDSSRVTGKLLGFFERVSDDSLPTSVQALRERLKEGIRSKEISRRLENIESLLAQRPILESQPVTPPIKEEELVKRAAHAKLAAQMEDAPSFFLAAAPRPHSEFPKLFSSRESNEAKVIDHPPKYRDMGFDLDCGQFHQMVNGQLIRRVSNGRKSLELWRDGALIFVGRADTHFLGWAARPSEDNLYINNFVLTEIVSLFLTLVVQVFVFAVPIPKEVAVWLGFTPTLASITSCELSNHRIAAPFGPMSGNKMAVEDTTFDSVLRLDGAVPEVEALRLLEKIYHWFGFTDDTIPYVDRSSDPHRVNRKMFS